MDRRLPIYLVIDCPGSLLGSPDAADELRAEVDAFVTHLRTDPMCAETVWLSVWAIANDVAPLMDLKQLADIREVPPLDCADDMPISLEYGLVRVALFARQAARRQTATTKGDWRPTLFLFSRRASTTDWAALVAPIGPVTLRVFVNTAWSPFMAQKAFAAAGNRDLRFASGGGSYPFTVRNWTEAHGWDDVGHFGAFRSCCQGHATLADRPLPDPPPEVHIVP